MRQVGWCGYDVSSLTLDVYADAGVGHDRESCHSVAGGIANIVGPNSSFVIGTVSKQQTAVSHSTPESEIVALEQVIRTLAIPADVLWSQVLGRPMRPCLK